MKKIHTQHLIKLSKQDLVHLNNVIHKGKQSARVIARAHTLLMTHEGMSKDVCAARIRVSRSVVQRVRDRFRSGGLRYALGEDPRSGQPRKLTTLAEAHLIAITCTNPPEGAHHWTLELLARQMVKDKKVSSISSVAIMHYLHQNDLKPWREKNVVYP